MNELRRWWGYGCWVGVRLGWRGNGVRSCERGGGRGMDFVRIMGLKNLEMGKIGGW